MKTIIAVLLLLTGMGWLTQPAWALRCGTHLIEPGDRAFEVRKACGKPVSETVIGYTLTHFGERELVIREWIYGPRNGVYDYLIFHGTTLMEIETRPAP